MLSCLLLGKTALLGQPCTIPFNYEGFAYDCVIQDDDINAATMYVGPYCNLIYTATDAAGCTYSDAYYFGTSIGCMVTSNCARSFRNSAYTSCLGCITANNCTDDCPLLPDLIVSPWMAVLGDDNTLNLDEHTLLLPVNTAAINIGLGPFEEYRTGEFYCCNADNTSCTPANATTNCADGSELKELIKQRIYKTNDDGIMTDEFGTTDAYVIYHPEHGHYHTENWIHVDLRKRPDSASDPNYSTPDNWQVVGDYNKLSFCVIDGINCIARSPFVGTNIHQNNILDMIDNYSGSSDHVWDAPTSTWWSDPNIVKNKRADFPNYFFGKEYSYQCNNATIQGMTPGFGDSYSSQTPGNSIVLPCDLADGKYYVVLEIDPLGLYQESNENNNLAIIPITLDMPEAIPFSNDIIAGDELSHYQTAGDPSSQPVWSLNNRINGIVKVGSGYTLTISHCTIEFMTPQSGIVVEKGGKLIVEHATLRGNECLGNVWKGIEVQGNGEIAHLGLGDTDPNHGLLQLDHAIIRDAKVGAQLRATPPPHGELLLWSGGGKVDAQNSQFIDCSAGIEFKPQRFENPSQISECQLLTDQGHSGTMRFPSIGHVGIYAYGVHTIPVTDCRFENLNPSNFTMEQRGVGIVAKSSNFIVGSTDSDEQGNEFVNLHKGIDAYSTNSLYGGMYIYNSQFDNVKRGITLNGCAMSEIAYNNFEVKIPGGYGVYALTSGGSTIAHNRFASHLPFDDTTPPQWAAVVSNAGNIYDTYVYDNYFTFGEAPPFNGQFYAATQIETPAVGQNRYVYIDCNEYAAHSQYDLYIDQNTPAFSNQGGCNPFDINVNPTANLWHTITGAALQQHIYYANPDANFQIICLPGHVPTQISSNVEVYICPDDENACDLFAEIGGDYAEKIANIRSRLLSTDLSDKEREALFAELLRSHVKAKQYAAAKADLEARDLLSDRKLLVATYTNERELAAATAKLAQIPLDEQPDIDFYNLFTAIIDDLETNPTPEYGDDGSGKVTMPLPEGIAAPALHQNKEAATILAQSVKASLQQQGYDRTPNYKTQTSQNPQEVAQVLHIAPNPAQSSVLVVWEQSYSNALLSLYDYTGKVVTQQNVSGKSSTIDISGLPNGILMTQLSQQGVIMATGKIIIIK